MEVEDRLIIECLSGNRQAQHELYRKCHTILLSTCRRYLKEKNEAVSLMNQGFLKILKNLDKYKIEVPFEAWIRKVMINVLIDNFRTNKKREEQIVLQEEFSDVADETYLDIYDAGQLLDAEEVEMMIRLLPTVSQLVFNLFAIDGYSHAEIAEKINIKAGTSKWHVNNARQLLQKMILTKYPELQTLQKKRKV